MDQLIQIIHKHIMHQAVYAKKGFVTLFSLIILMVISVSVFTNILLVNTDSLNSIEATRDGINARSLANSCVEIGLNKLRTDNVYTGDEIFDLTEGSCEILPIQGSGNDDLILQKAFIENWILITNDKDFGEKVYRERRPHHGVILLRLEDERAVLKIETIQRLLKAYSDRIIDQFIVVTGTKVRFARQSPPHRGTG